MGKRTKPELIDIDAANRPSQFSIRRDGRKITLTHGEVYEATKSLVRRMVNDSLGYFAEVYLNDSPEETRKLAEENMVRTILAAIPHDIMEMANKEMGGEDAPPIEYLFSMDSKDR